MTRSPIAFILGHIAISFLVSFCSGSFMFGQKLPKDPRPQIKNLIPNTPQTIHYKGREVMKTLCTQAGLQIQPPRPSGKTPSTTSDGGMRFKLCKLQDGEAVEILGPLDFGTGDWHKTRNELRITEEDALQLHYWSDSESTSSANANF